MITSLTNYINWWTTKSNESVRQQFNIELYFKILKAKGLIK